MAKLIGKGAIVWQGTKVIAYEATIMPMPTKTPWERMADKIGDLCCRDLRRIERKWKRSR